MWLVLFISVLFSPFSPFRLSAGETSYRPPRKWMQSQLSGLWNTSKELLRVLCFQLTEDATPKMLVTLDQCHNICYHYNRFVRWWKSFHFCPWAAKGSLDCSHVIGLVPLSHCKGRIRLKQRKLPPSCLHQSLAQGTFSDSCTRSLRLKSAWLWVP